MANVFFISDQHFHHANILTFKNRDGSMLRPGFADVESMNEHMVAMHNSVVGHKDKVYFLGDVTMGTKVKDLEILSRLNGCKILIKGNHDLAKPEAYLAHFKDIRAVHQFEGLILSHIPIHEESLGRWKVNVHGHLHSNAVMKNGITDNRYFCASVERINYTPISLEQVKHYAHSTI